MTRLSACRTFNPRVQIVLLSEVPMPMRCEEKAGLVGEYNDATLAFSKAA